MELNGLFFKRTYIHLYYNWHKWVQTCYCVYCKIKIQNFIEVYCFTTLTPEHSVRNRNGKESLTEEILAQSFENNQLINTAPMKNSVPFKEGMYGIFDLYIFDIYIYHQLLVPLCFDSSFLLTNIITFILFRNI